MAVSDSEPHAAARPKPGGGMLGRILLHWIAGLRPSEGRARPDRIEKRAYFTNRWLGIALITPQLLLIFTFFYWPAGEALYWAFTLERPWGGGNEWVGFGNFSAILSDHVYWNSVVSSIVFALASTGLGMAMAFVLAILTDRELKGHLIYRTVLVLRHYENLKLREIAEVLDIPDGTVNSRMAEGLAQLTRLLEPEFGKKVCHPAKAPSRQINKSQEIFAL